MKIDFDIDPNGYNEYCVHCHSRNTLSREPNAQGLLYACSSCHQNSPRAIIIDPKLLWRIAGDKEYCHSSVGVFIFNDKNELLMFELTKYPFGFTIPAGHLDVEESATKAIKREVKEEVDIPIKDLVAVLSATIDGDGCRRGSDRHEWVLFCARAASTEEPVVDVAEGVKPEWVTLQKALSRVNCFAVDYLLKHHLKAINSYLTRKN